VNPRDDAPVGRRLPFNRPRSAWALLAACVAALPFVRGLTGNRIFYIRDLSLYFWGRYLWLRHAWLSSQWPLWDPYVGGGQPAYSDALHQMFLLPAVAVRLIGNDVLGFNLWVALPFPLAAIGGFLFFGRRFSAAAAALAAIVLALCGPIVSTGNFPSMSWSVAMMPWVLWAADAVVSVPSVQRLAVLAVMIALQAFAGEPVTQFATLLLTCGYVMVVGAPNERHTWRAGIWNTAAVIAGAAIGATLAAIQLIPMAYAAVAAQRSEGITPEVWSLRPAALLETVWLHLFGNYYTSQSLAEVPWMPLMFTGREPFFFSIYFGVPLLALCVYGLAGSGPRRWRLFWVAAGFVSLVAAFGAYTPLYSIVRDHVPLVGSFRFPVKYLIVAAMAVAAGVAAGWDALVATAPRNERRISRARITATGLAIVIGGGAGLLALACLVIPVQVGTRFEAFAHALGAPRGALAAAFMLRTVPVGAVPIVTLSLATAVLLLLATAADRATPRAIGATLARRGLYVLVIGDLLAHAWGINPVFDARYVAEPAWLLHTKSDADARFYVGGKKDGTLDALDMDASRAYMNPPGLTGSASRAALSIEAAHYPSGWHAREMLSYDLAVLWPRRFTTTSERFMNSSREERDRFLSRTGVRFRILPIREASGHAPLMPIPYFLESFLFDWGADVMPRLAVVSEVRVVPDDGDQIAMLFQPGWESRTTALIERPLAAAGNAGPPVAPFARFLEDTPNKAVIEAGAGAQGGHLLLLDSYSSDWSATVDGRRADMGQADGLFRSVHLTSGRHVVAFTYRPTALLWGSGTSSAALFLTLGLLGWTGARKAALVAQDLSPADLADEAGPKTCATSTFGTSTPHV
jgi:hypothetical protein